MKGLNVKRIAALGLGAALVGSALAPAVMAGVFNNVDTLQKSNIVNSTGTPVVDIVVGSMGQAADVVWAGNIAAKVAQLATVDATAAAPTVDFTVGGSTTITGDGKLIDDRIVTASTSLALTVDNGDSTVLVDESDYEYDINGDTHEVDITETLYSTATAGLQTDGEGILPGQLVANVDANQIGYRINFSPALTSFTKDDDVEMSIPFLGKTWEVRSISGSSNKVELRASELSDKLFVGEIVKVAGIGAYAGKQLDLVLTEVAAAEDNASSYLAEFELRDGSTVIDVLSDAEAGTDLQDKFDKYFSTPVSVDTVYRQIDTSKGYVRLDTGDQAWDLKDGEELKDDGNDNAEKWLVELDFNGDNYLKGIYVYNSDLTYAISDADSSDLQGTKDDAYRMGPMAANTSVDIADAGKYKFSFLGLTTEKMYEGSIADGVLSLTIDNKLQEVPLSLGGSSGFTENSSKTVTVLGEEYTLYYDADANTLKSFHNISDSTDVDADAGDVEIDFYNTIAGNFSDGNIMTFSDGDVDVKYNVIAYFNDTDEITYILGLSSKAQNTALAVQAGTDAAVDFNGTYADKNSGDSTIIPYYLPVDMPDDIFDNWKASDKNVLESDDQDLYSALFTIDDGSGVKVFARVDTKSGDLIDTDTDYAGVGTTDPQAEFGSIKLDSSVEDELVATGTPFGTEISVADSKFTWSIPEDRRYAQYYLGAMATEATTDGAKYTNVAVDGVKGNVTIDAINGTAGKSVVKVGNIVKLDTEAVSGKAIIVGGQLVNNMAKNLQIDGVTIQERLGNNGDYVAAVLDNGSVVVAGWTSNDTAMAARALIAQLESFM